MKLADLKGEYFVLWACPPGEEVPFEVSREVATPLLPECPTSPYCPGERVRRLTGEAEQGGAGRRASRIVLEPDPDFKYDPSLCPYGFDSKTECFRAINTRAFREGCFGPRDVKRAANFLKALGYTVKAERVRPSDLEGERILMAHGPIFNFHDLRCENGPGGLVLYLIRNPHEDESPPGCSEI